jgi:luciferase family oxidoreductase group 1
MRLSVLDQSTVNDSMPQSQAITETIALAKICEELGYYRYWVAEHHNSASVAGTAPEILVAALSTVTSTIRLGSAGVLLHFYSPFKVAEQFSVIESIAPGRIDLGLGRAPGADGLAARALNEHFNPATDFKEKIKELLYWTDGVPLPEDHVHAHGLVTANPLGYSSPDVWVLGSSVEGATTAAELGLPYCFAHFFNDGEHMEEALRLYKSLYVPSERFPTPYIAVCISALAADTAEEAIRQSQTRDHWRIGFGRNQRNPLVHPDNLPAADYTDEEFEKISKWHAKAIVGTVDQIKEKLLSMSNEYGIDEFVINTWTYDFKSRVQSYQLLSKLIK